VNLLPRGPTNDHEGHTGLTKIQRETAMTTKSKISAALAVLTLATSLAIPTNSAQAGHRGWGLGAALVGSAIVGAAVVNSAPYGGYYVDGYRRCGFERQYNSLGYYIGTVKVCRIY
jgi:hypothetical protein